MNSKNMKYTVFTALIVTTVLASLFFIPIVSEENSLTTFFGSFHPLILHLPIGALIALFLLETIHFFQTKIKN